MTFSTLGDLAQTFALRHRNTALKTEIQRIGQELSSGQAADLASHLGGSYTHLTSVERDMRLLDAYAINLTEAKQMTQVMQTRLEQIAEISNSFANDLIASSALSSIATEKSLMDDAGAQFKTIVATLNTQSAGRVLFGGDEALRSPLVDADTILDEIASALSGVVGMSNVETAIDDWFADPSGFDSIAYMGGANPTSPIKMSPTAELAVDVRANATELKDILASLAKVHFGDDTRLTHLDDRNALRSNAALDLLTAQESLIGLQAELGLAQEQIEKWSVRNETERSTLQFTKGALLMVDPYERATELEAAQFQLESLYTITSRLSRLSLVNFLR